MVGPGGRQGGARSGCQLEVKFSETPPLLQVRYIHSKAGQGLGGVAPWQVAHEQICGWATCYQTGSGWVSVVGGLGGRRWGPGGAFFG